MDVLLLKMIASIYATNVGYVGCEDYKGSGELFASMTCAVTAEIWSFENKDVTADWDEE